jgi:cupin fold WbuC family metalloprotein
MLKRIRGSKTTAFTHTDQIILVDDLTIRKLKHAVLRDPLRRARLCLHRSTSDAVQEMIVVMHKDTYVRPHRHIGRTESVHIMEGRGTVIFFNASGKPVRSITLTTDGNKGVFVYRLSYPRWHMFVPLTEFVVVHEVISGPHLKSGSESAAWSPDEHDIQGISDFKAGIQRFIG